MKRVLVPVLALLVAALLPACGPEKKNEEKIRPADTGAASARHPGETDVIPSETAPSGSTRPTRPDETIEKPANTPPPAAAGSYEYGKPVPRQTRLCDQPVRAEFRLRGCARLPARD